MRTTLQTVAQAGVLAIGTLLVLQTSVHAGCGGGGGYGRAWGGHTFNAGYGGGYHGGGGCGAWCGMDGMAMGGMAMPASGGYQPYVQPTSYYPQNGGYPAATTQPAQPSSSHYYCPMHPNIVSSTPGTCPICHMALSRR